MGTNSQGRTPVTIVIPIYGDLPSLQRCISSVIDTVDLKVNRLLLLNDCGPDADVIEAAVLSQVDGVTGVRYERNPHNLGFVGTCNRAALELDTSDNDILLLNSDASLTPGAFDEMVEILHLNEKHGIVHPRSNNAAIASVPLVPLEEIGADAEVSARVYAGLRDSLPRFTITPVAVGFCFLVRRQLIRNYGFFDEIYAPGYSEENDFCLRVNRFGYSAVMANRAFVGHEGSKSFSSPSRLELMHRNEALMRSRYPYYHVSVLHYLEYGVDPLDWFAERIWGGRRPKVLIDMFHMSLIYNGSTRNALSFLELLTRRAPDLDVDFTLVSSAEAIEFFDLRQYGFPVVVNGNLEEIFDLGFALSPVSDPRQINVLNRHCVRWVVSHFDIIALRMLHLLEVSYTRRQVVLDSLVWADRVIPISNAALDDIDDFFGAEAAGVREHSTVIHEGAADITFPETPQPAAPWDPETVAVVDRGGFVLVVGNVFSHKQLPETLTTLVGLPSPVVGFGSLGGAAAPDGVIMIEGGMLSDQQVDELYRKATCVVFPSSYEGFGLPIVEAALRNRPLVLFDMAVSREVVDSLGVGDLTRFFSTFDDLPRIVGEIMEAEIDRPVIERHLRPLDDYNQGILDVLLAELEKPVDLDRLSARVRAMRRLELHKEPVEGRLAEASAKIASPSYRIGRMVVRPFRPFRGMIRAGYRLIRRR